MVAASAPSPPAHRVGRRVGRVGGGRSATRRHTPAGHPPPPLTRCRAGKGRPGLPKASPALHRRCPTPSHRTPLNSTPPTSPHIKDDAVQSSRSRTCGRALSCWPSPSKQPRPSPPPSHNTPLQPVQQGIRRNLVGGCPCGSVATGRADESAGQDIPRPPSDALPDEEGGPLQLCIFFSLQTCWRGSS